MPTVLTSAVSTESAEPSRKAARESCIHRPRDARLVLLALRRPQHARTLGDVGHLERARNAGQIVLGERPAKAAHATGAIQFIRRRLIAQASSGERPPVVRRPLRLMRWIFHG